MNYAPRAKPQPVCERGEFRCAAIGLDHGHINGMCLNLADAGAEIVSVFDPDRTKVDEFREKFPMARVVSSAKEILDDDSIQLVVSAAITSERGPLGLEVMDHGKHYFSDKAPFTTPRQWPTPAPRWQPPD